MKALHSLVAGGLILATGVVSTQSPFAAASLAAPQEETQTESQEKALSARVEALEMEVKTLQEENAQMRKLLDGTLAYLEAQARASKEMLEVLDLSESEGFTKGINFRSRETLLGGFRAYWQKVGKGLPKAAAKPKPAGNGRPTAPARRR